MTNNPTIDGVSRELLANAALNEKTTIEVTE